MRQVILGVLTALAVAAILGCPASEPVVVKHPEPSSTSGVTPPMAAPAPSGGGVVADEDFASYKKEYDTAKAAYEKNTQDDKKKKSYVNATVKLGTATMYANLDSKIKYRDALRLYREALKVDPKNEEALTNKQQIEGIYLSLKRPIPE